MNQTLKALIVDDEPAARRLMRFLLETHKDHIEIIAEAVNGEEAIQLIDELKPDLVFLDIQMPDYTGFEVLEKISFQPNVIFTTAYEQYAIKAFENFSIDYLLKPIREERLEQSLQKLKNFGKTGKIPELDQLKMMIAGLNKPKLPTAFAVKLGDKIILINFESISHFEAEDKYVFLYKLDGKKHLTDQTLSALEIKLPDNFIRVQKSFIINKEKIKEIHKHFNGRFIIIMDDKIQTRITTGLTFYGVIKETLGI